MWVHKFDNSKRHCWQNTEGKFLIAAGFDDVECGNPQDHPYSRGVSEYMRWIRFLGREFPGVVTEFPDEEWLTLGQDTMTAAPYFMTRQYCENYGGILKAFLFNTDGFAVVEIHEDSLIPYAEKALELTNASYAEEMVGV